jgi:neutral ceramidase
MTRSAIPLCLFLTMVNLPAAGFEAGIGRADITPEEPVRLAGYASRDTPFTKVAQKLFVKALALKDSAGRVSVLLTADTIGTPAWFNDELAARVQSELAVPRERFLFACSHSHSAPVIAGCLEDMYDLSPEEKAAVERYTALFLARSFEAAREAVSNLAPAKLSFGQGQAGFAGNRRGFGPRGVGFGINPIGAVDHSVPVLMVSNSDGAARAVVFGYACHCTTPGASDEVAGDWAGFACENLETTFPGVTALAVIGCGADANPNPRGTMLMARGHGLELAGAVAAVMRQPLRPVEDGPIGAAFESLPLPLEPPPTREQLQTMLAQDKRPPTQRYYQGLIDQLARGEPLISQVSCPVQVWRFGQAFTLVGIGGEVVVDYSLRLKRERPDERLWVAGYCNDVFGYLPSQRILVEGGYEADASRIYYGIPSRFAPETEDRVIEAVNRLIENASSQPIPAR